MVFTGNWCDNESRPYQACRDRRCGFRSEIIKRKPAVEETDSAWYVINITRHGSVDNVFSLRSSCYCRTLRIRTEFGFGFLVEKGTLLTRPACPPPRKWCPPTRARSWSSETSGYPPSCRHRRRRRCCRERPYDLNGFRDGSVCVCLCVGFVKKTK